MTVEEPSPEKIEELNISPTIDIVAHSEQLTQELLDQELGDESNSQPERVIDDNVPEGHMESSNQVDVENDTLTSSEATLMFHRRLSLKSLSVSLLLRGSTYS